MKQQEIDIQRGLKKKLFQKQLKIILKKKI